MIKKGKIIYEKYKGLLANLGYLTILKSFNLILPLLVYPYLIRVLGIDNYGLVVFAEATIMYLVILISFGFELSATKEVSIHRDNPEKINEIVSSVYIIKGLIFLVCLLFLFIGLSFFPQHRNYKLLFLLTMHLAVFELLFPLWFFLGIEKMKYITYLNLLNRGAFFILMLLFIKSKNDFLLVPLIHGIGSLMVICFSFYILYFKEKVRFKIPKKVTLVNYFKESLIYFSSTFSIQIFTNSNRFLIGSFLGMTNLAYYDIVEKIIRILSVPTALLRTILLPFVSKTRDKLIVRNVTKMMTLFSLIIVSLVLVFSDNLIELILGSYNSKASYYLKIYSFIIIFYNLSNYYLVVSINAFGYQKKFMELMIYSMLIYLFLIFLILTLEVYIVEYFIFSLFIVELFIVIMTYKIAKEKKLL
jgi:O-antigen/teichoic acid export membrane protein